MAYPNHCAKIPLKGGQITFAQTWSQRFHIHPWVAADLRWASTFVRSSPGRCCFHLSFTRPSALLAVLRVNSGCSALSCLIFMPALLLLAGMSRLALFWADSDAGTACDQKCCCVYYGSLERSWSNSPTIPALGDAGGRGGYSHAFIEVTA